MLAIERREGKENLSCWQAFRATNVGAYAARPTLMLVAREQGTGNWKKGLKSDLVELRLGMMDGMVDWSSEHNRSELLAVVGLYADAGMLTFASSHCSDEEADIRTDFSQTLLHKHIYPAVGYSAILPL